MPRPFFLVLLIVVLVCYAAVPGLCAAIDPMAATSGVTGETAYVGAINGNLSIHMRLAIHDGKLSGSYYYDSIKRDIILRGKMDGPQIRIGEYDDSGREKAEFRGIFVAPDRIEGVWTVYNPKREGFHRDVWTTIYPFYLQAEYGDGAYEAGQSAQNSEAWAGLWRRPVLTSASYGEVKILFVTDRSFWFELYQQSGGSSGVVRGMAVFEDGGAVFRDERGGAVHFNLQNGKLRITTNDKLIGYAGNGVMLDGEYTRGEPRRRTFYQDTEVLESLAQEEQFKEMTGPYYERFINYFHLGGRNESLDGPDIKAFSGYMRALWPYYQCIVMRSSRGAMWAAILTDNDSLNGSVIVYFASDKDYGEPIPKTIAKWIQDIQDRRTKQVEVLRYNGST